MSFLPDNYEQPIIASAYTKLEQGDNSLRILSPTIQGWLGWNITADGRKPTRAKNREECQSDDKIKHFWAMVVWNYKANQIQIWEVTQATIQNAILVLYKNPKWGDPKDYDLVISRKGEGMDTEYHVTPNPKEPTDQAIFKAWRERPCDLTKLYTGDDPWELTEAEKAEQIKKINDLPF